MAKNKTRDNILKSAEKLFAENGYDGVPTKEIALQAGITEMTLFNHFHSKEQLYKAVVKERYLAIEIKSCFPELSYDSLEHDLKIISDRILTNYIDNKTILKIRLKEKQSFHEDETFKIENDPILIQITPIFMTYYKKGDLRISGEKAALLFISTLKGLCHICLLENRKQDDIHELIDEYVTTFCIGMKN